MDADISVRYAACTFRVEVLFMSQTQLSTENGDSIFLRNMDDRIRQYAVMEDKRTQSGSLPLWKPEKVTKHLQTPEKSWIFT